MNDTKYQIVKFINQDIAIDVNVSPEEDTVWLTQKQIAVLFNVSVDNVSLHIKNILIEGELDDSVIEESSITASDKKKYKTKLYNLDMIISVGYRVKSKQSILFRKWANNILKEYLIKGYVINANRSLVTNDNFVNLINRVETIGSRQTEMNKRLLTIENKIHSKEIPIEKIFFHGEFYDAYSLIQEIFKKANNEIIIIDNYIDKTLLDRLVVKKRNVNVIVYHDLTKSGLLGTDIKIFNKQYGGLNVVNTTKVHDRYIVIDKLVIYHIGASLKDLGKKIFSISESNPTIINTLLNNL